MWYILYAIDKTKNILINALTVAFTIDNEAPYQIDAEDKTVPAYEGSEPLDLTVYAHDAVDGKFEIGPQSIVDATIVIYKEKTRKISCHFRNN